MSPPGSPKPPPFDFVTSASEALATVPVVAVGGCWEKESERERAVVGSSVCARRLRDPHRVCNLQHSPFSSVHHSSHHGLQCA